MRNITMGTLISGTMRQEALIPCFVDEILRIDPDNATAKYVKERMDKGEDEEGVSLYYDTLDSYLDLDNLFDELNDLCADCPYVYFGASEGDGADYGYWVSWDSLVEDIDNGNLSAYGSPEESQSEYTYVVMDDPENPTKYQSVTLYQDDDIVWEV